MLTQVEDKPVISEIIETTKKEKTKKILHPATLFFIFTLLVIFASHIFKGTSVTYFDARIGAEKVVTARSILSADGINYLVTTAVSNFVNFAPLGTIIIAMLGVGLADGSGLINASLKKLVAYIPPFIITFSIILLSMISNIASDVGYVLLVPLGAIVFVSFGRHPLAGMAASFAGVAGGYSANFLLTTLDQSLSAITTTAIKSATIDFAVTPQGNLYFFIASVLILTFFGTLITEKIVEPRLGLYKSIYHIDTLEILPKEKKGLIFAGISFIVLALVLGYIIINPNSIFIGEDKTLRLFIYSGGLVLFVSLLILIPSLIFGVISGTIKSDRDVVKMMSEPVGQLNSFFIILFFAAQFISLFEYSNIGTIVVLNGANSLIKSGFDGLALFFSFIILVALLNLFTGSATAKWAILAPIFIPVFYRLGINPQLTEVAYRIGDSSTNVITPLLPYFIVFVIFTQKYQRAEDRPISVGKIISIMLPYSIGFLVIWTTLLALWLYFGLPFGF